MSKLSPDSKVKFYPSLEHTISFLTGQFDNKPDERRLILNELSSLIQNKINQQIKIELVFICTHNSRRSHIAQLWAQAAAAYYGVENLISYSGGMETTSFNPRAIRAMNDIGFRVDKSTEGENPIYVVSFSEDVVPVFTFSKKYDAESNPKEKFTAVMTCSDADENCPVVSGAERRISLPYNDPKDFDGTQEESQRYIDRVMEIGREILFAFSNIKRI